MSTAAPGSPAAHGAVDDAATPPRRRSIAVRGLRAAGWVLCLLIGAGTVALAIGSLLDPTASLYPMVSSSLWVTAGPWLTLLTSGCLVAAAVGLRRRPRRLSAAVGVVAAVALGSSLVVTAQITLAAYAAGGSADPVRGLVTSSMSAQPDASVTYTVAAGTPLSAVVYRPARGARPAPVLMYVHGGGWIIGAAADLGHDMRWFADRGWLVISVDYRLATPTHATWDEAPRDVACALVWTRTNAAGFGGDPARVAVAGDSAGGNLAVNLAWSAALGQASSGCGGQVTPPQAVLVQYPVVDPQDAYDHGFPAPNFEPAMFTERYLGGSPEQFPERLRAITSATYLTPAAPPTLIIEPDRDGLIPTAGVLRFADRARAAGARLTLARIPWAGHVYDETAGSLGNQAGLSIREHFLRTNGLAP